MARPEEFSSAEALRVLVQNMSLKIRWLLTKER